MRATILHATRDIRLDDVDDPQLVDDGDAVVRVVAACICGSDLWPYRGQPEVHGPGRIGHEFVGIVEETGSDVQTVAPGDFVIAPFVISDNTCELCRRGMHTSCVNGAALGRRGSSGTHGRRRAGRGRPRPPGRWDARRHARLSRTQALIPHLLTLSDVYPTGHHAALSAGVTSGQHRGCRRRRRRGPVRRPRCQASRSGSRRGDVTPRGPSASRSRVRCRRDRRRARQGGCRRREGDLRRPRRGPRARVRRHPGQHETGDAEHPTGRPGRVRRACRTASSSTSG